MLLSALQCLPRPRGGTSARWRSYDLQHLARHLRRAICESKPLVVGHAMMRWLLLIACTRPEKEHSAVDTQPDSEWLDSPPDTAPLETCEGDPYVLIDVDYWTVCAVKQQGCVVCWNQNNTFVQNIPVQPYKQIEIMKAPLAREGYEWSNWESYVCALSEEGEIACTEGFTFAEIPEGPFKKISVGTFHLCGLKEDGEIVCVGDDKTGETEVPEGKYIDVVALYLRTCALTESGKLICWGNGSYWDNLGPMDLGPGTFVSLEEEYNEVCGIRVDGKVACTQSWFNWPQGYNPPDIPFLSVSLGFGVSAIWGMGIDLDGHLQFWFGNEDFPEEDTELRFSQYSQGASYNGCGITVSGELRCYGDIPSSPP